MNNTENTYSIILRDHESGEYYIAEITNDWDIDRIEKEAEKLTQETYEDDWSSNFIEELSSRTWINIYETWILEI